MWASLWLKIGVAYSNCFLQIFACKPNRKFPFQRDAANIFQYHEGILYTCAWSEPNLMFGLMFFQCWPPSLVDQFCKNLVCNFEDGNWTRRKQIATLGQHSKDCLTPTRVKTSNGKHTIERIQYFIGHVNHRGDENLKSAK